MDRAVSPEEFEQVSRALREKCVRKYFREKRPSIFPISWIVLSLKVLFNTVKVATHQAISHTLPMLLRPRFCPLSYAWWTGFPHRDLLRMLVLRNPLGGRPPQHHRIQPARDELAILQLRLQLPMLHNDFAPQYGHYRPARHLPAFPGTVVADMKVLAR